MKRLLAVCLCTGLLVLAPRSLAQSPPGLSVQVSNGAAWLSITGAVGMVYQVQYVTNLAQTNVWLWLTNLTLASNPQLWVDTSGPATGRRFYRAIWVPTNMDMVLIPAGSFTMGNCMASSEGNSDELPLHTVYVSAFYMDKYLVTKSLWDTVYQWAIAHGYTFDYAGSGKASTHPVQTIDWYDCVKWCNARSEKEGKTPAYYTDAGLSVRYRTGQVDVQTNCVNWSSGYRLPTEAEWEKAARGGASGQRFPWGNTISWSQANYYAYPSGYAYDVNPTSGYDTTFNDGVSPYTSPMGYFAANGYGLYDMAGNVWQWCWDLCGSYSSGSQTDPRGPASGSARVNRGGSWYGYAIDCRAARRGCIGPTFSDFDFGFRSVLPAGQ